jgi:hypothetical protein
MGPAWLCAVEVRNHDGCFPPLGDCPAAGLTTAAGLSGYHDSCLPPLAGCPAAGLTTAAARRLSRRWSHDGRGS